MLLFSSMSSRPEVEAFRVPEGTFLELATALLDPKRGKERGKAGRHSKEFVNGGVKLILAEAFLGVPGIEVILHGQLSKDPDDFILFTVEVGTDDALRPSPRTAKLQPDDPYTVLSEALIERGIPMPEMNQERVDELFNLVRQTITLSY